MAEPRFVFEDERRFVFEDEAPRPGDMVLVRRGSAEVLDEPPPEAPTAQPGEKTFAQKLVRGSAPSIVGGALGAAGGTIAAPFTAGVINPLTGAMIGGAAGEAVQQFFDPLDAGTAAETGLGKGVNIALAGLGPAAVAGARRFFLSLPGAAAGMQEFLLTKFGATGDKLVSKVAPPPGTASRLFDEARALGAQAAAAPGAIGGNAVPLGRTAQVAKEISEEVATSKFATGASKGLAKRAQDFAGQNQVPFDEFRLNQSDVGAVVRSLERKGGAALGRAKQLYAAMWDDLDTFTTEAARSGNPVGQKLSEAIAAFKQEEAGKFVKDAWIKSTVRRVGQQNIDVDAFMTKIDRSRDVLEKLLPGDAIDDVLATMKEVAKIPVMAKTPRLGFEQMPFAERAVVGLALGAIGGAATGSMTGATIGGGMGVLAVEGLSIALTSPVGRALVRTLAAEGKNLPQIARALVQPTAYAQTGRVAVGAGAQEAARRR